MLHRSDCKAGWNRRDRELASVAGAWRFPGPYAKRPLQLRPGPWAESGERRGPCLQRPKPQRTWSFPRTILCSHTSPSFALNPGSLSFSYKCVAPSPFRRPPVNPISISSPSLGCLGKVPHARSLKTAERYHLTVWKPESKIKVSSGLTPSEALSENLFQALSLAGRWLSSP